MRSLWRELIVTVVLAAVIFLLLRLVVGGHSVEGNSMSPALNPGERVLINKLAFKYSQPERGDIVYYTSAEKDSPQLERIIGLPGDIIEVKERVVYINKMPLKEPYVKNPPRYTITPYQVPSGNYFILADNRNLGNDTLIGWTVPQEDILGRAWVCAWPPDKWGGVDNFPLDSQLTESQSP
ncbi:MAG: lepB [Chloroflexi bacterium]|nr:lepB [Chloroflexota bacterium]